MIDIKNGNQTAKILGIVFIAVAVLGFIPNPIVSPTGWFVVNAVHNLVHLLAGVVLLVGVQMKMPKKTLMAVGIVYSWWVSLVLQP